MTASLNSTGASNARARIAAGDVEREAEWAFSAEDRDALLGSEDWAGYSKWFLGVDANASAKTKPYYKYPFGKQGKVYRSALMLARAHAREANDRTVYAAAGNLIASVDARKEAQLPNEFFSSLVLKATDDSQRTFTGIASTPSTDRQGDIVEPMGARFSLPIPLLWQHDSRQPIGWVERAKATKDGIEIFARIAKDALLPKLDEAWGYIRSGLVKGLSIGFDPVEWTRMEETGGYHFLVWDWLELSSVTLPANEQATITTIKSFDSVARAAASRMRRRAGVVYLHEPPGVSGLMQRRSHHHQP